MSITTVDNKLQNDLITKVREGMERLSWTQDDLAARSGVTQGNISQLLGAKRSGTLATWNKLVRAIEAA